MALAVTVADQDIDSPFTHEQTRKRPDEAFGRFASNLEERPTTLAFEMSVYGCLARMRRISPDY